MAGAIITCRSAVRRSSDTGTAAAAAAMAATGDARATRRRRGELIGSASWAAERGAGVSLSWEHRHGAPPARERAAAERRMSLPGLQTRDRTRRRRWRG